MKIHEFQSKEILKRFGVPVPTGQITRSAEEAYEIAKRLGGVVAVKAQIHAGGRGKGGGIKIARSPQEAEDHARQILCSRLVTPQTGPAGSLVRQILIEEGLNLAREFYLGIILDRAENKPVVMVSTEGGVEIEEVASKTPELILKEHVDPAVGLQPFQGRNLSYGLGLESGVIRRMGKVMAALYEAFLQTDATLVEINPLVLTEEGDLYALDAKMNFDDNALYRHPEIEAYRDFQEEEPLEIQASRSNLNYIKLDGNVGCMVNGAGLAMATMDIIKLSGGSPANFLDVGWGSQRGSGPKRLQDPGLGRERQSGAHQYFRGHHALRHRGGGRRSGRQGPRSLNPSRSAAGRNQCRRGKRDSPELGSGVRGCNGNG